MRDDGLKTEQGTGKDFYFCRDYAYVSEFRVSWFFFHEFGENLEKTMTDTREGKVVEDTHGEEEQHSLNEDLSTH